MSKTMNAYAAELPIVVGSWCEKGPAGKRHFLPYSEVESRRGMMAWHRILTKSGIRRGQTALVVSITDDVHQVMPLEMALDDTGVIILNADASYFEAQRIEAFIRNFDPEYIFGLTGATLDGLSAAGHAIEKLLQGRRVWVRDCAFPTLVSMSGFQLTRWTGLGPAALIGCGHNDALHLDGMEWVMQIDDDIATLTHRLSAAETAPVQTAAGGAWLLHAFCACGSSDPLVSV